ncbi:MAG TPA: glycerophosphodiester phosphodiesterase family protein [Polyangiaceae bacterium]
MSRQAALRYWRCPEGRRPWVLGHRGVRGPHVSVAENTLGAFDAAIAAGADGVELDVRLAKDAAVVVMHDETLSRVTLGAHTERVDALTLAELRTVVLPGEQRISTLEEVLAWSKLQQCRLNVELKYDGHGPTPLAEHVAALVASNGSPERLLFSSFDATTALDLAQRLEDYVVAWLTEDPVDVTRAPEVLLEHGIVAIHPKHALLNATTLRALRERFALVNTWTVNDTTRVTDLAALGVDTIITDDPAAALGALAEV